MQLIPNKNLGQHWLKDDKTLHSICDQAELTATDTVLEIGPGLGTLTEHLARRANKVVALEFDKKLATLLQKKFIHSNVTILQGDVLSFDLTTLSQNYKVVANLPYYITSKIVRLLLESTNPPTLATLLVQKEVAERMAAEPGEMSILAVSVQFYSQPTLGPMVLAQLFTPPPQVDSQIITLRLRGQPLFADVDRAQFFRVVRAGFGEKRKKLRNSLSGGLQLPKEQTQALLTTANIPLSARAEQLGLDDWHRLTLAYQAVL